LAADAHTEGPPPLTKQRVLAIFLDGYEQSLAEEMIAAGEMPSLAQLGAASARFLLDHGAAQRTGLAGEHISTGISHEDARRWAAIHFDRDTYAVWQEGTSMTPFAAHLAARTVVFDPTYYDLRRAPAVRGIVGWGTHDTGVGVHCAPDDLFDELTSRFGPYPAEDWIYGTAWQSTERARLMGEALAAAVPQRARAARWLLQKRMPDWDLALVGVSEGHSVIEGLWHGIDSTHRLHGLPSAKPAGEGVRAVFRAIDALVGELTQAFPDAAKVVFAPSGMGPNRSDVPSMVLLAELLYRHAFRRPLLNIPARWLDAADGLPLLSEDEGWPSGKRLFARRQTRLQKMRTRLERRLPWLRADGPKEPPSRGEGPIKHPVLWLPATRFQPHWRRMPAFALPSFYDGRIRINLKGRERHGVVRREDYDAVRDQIEALVRECTDPVTGEGVVDFTERHAGDPMTLNETDADLVVVWRDSALAFDHPRLGRIGPIPFRRTGGHTGRYGMALVSAPGVEPGDRDVRSTFDVVPTLIELLGEPLPDGLSGSSLLPEVVPTPA
jgi:hypothetical protein